MKIMYALWGSGLDSALRADQLHEALRAAGAHRLQVNLDDADVAAAMLRITHFDAPVRAVVSVWTEADPVEISKLLSGLAERIAGWEVEERTPLVPPRMEDGVRAAALAQIGFLRIPVDLDAGEWLRRWQSEHTSVAIETQSTFGYVQNRVLRTVFGSDQVDALVEELFPPAAMTDAHAFYGSGGDDAELQRRIGLMVESITRFGANTNLDSVPTSRYTYELASGHSAP
ncbi:hypothetical protein [Prescottella agglutinans]|uniref:EthD domain-containing protein n=1 Tax=Prescottella agglutinans TaxID=1644129 RepID=A0ABT6M6C1_9NOCA|nr:hypothetical protein [Prescottella agglutinans]MDH6279858.1 hypothetical protein [Prescottella agglutinans]